MAAILADTWTSGDDVMAKNIQQLDSTERPRLIVALESATKNLEERIQMGIELYNNSSKAEFESRYRKWNKYNEDLLQSVIHIHSAKSCKIRRAK